MIDTLEARRSDFPALRQRVWFENGVVSLTPLPVARYLTSLFDEIVDGGPPHVTQPEIEFPRRAASIATIASLLHCRADDLAVMRGVSEGYQTVVRGMDWRAGDELILSGDEEAALQVPAWHLRDTEGVVLKTFELKADVEEQLAEVERLITPRTRLIAFSHVTTDLGFRLPAAEIGALARRHEVRTFLDTAHSLGLVDVDLSGWQIDFAGAISYKWNYGPYAAGVLYVAPERLDELALRYAGNRSELWFDFNKETFGIRDTVERFQYGPWSWPIVHSWAFAIGYLRELGLGAIAERTFELARMLKAGLADIAGVHLYTPVEDGASAALVAFSVDGMDQDELRDQLKDRWAIDVRSLLGRETGVRASVAFFNTQDEVDILLSAVRVLAVGR